MVAPRARGWRVRGLCRVPVGQRQQALGSDGQPRRRGLQLCSAGALRPGFTELLPAPRGNVGGRVQDGLQGVGSRPDPGEGPERGIPQVLLRLDTQDHGGAQVQVCNARGRRAQAQTGGLAVADAGDQGDRPRQAEQARDLRSNRAEQFAGRHQIG